MPAQYPYNIDITHRAGQDEILYLWSAADLAVGQAAWITKMTHEEVFALAKERGVSPPSEKLLASKYVDLDARMQPLARKGVLRQARELVNGLRSRRADVDGILTNERL
ncbi:hypothetical protein [Rhizobium johnstonii]|uniref:hypothetical protein n=1 Tax=Rhizobium johnstonii TaxID=3019933 RepID=UPI003F997601